LIIVVIGFSLKFVAGGAAFIGAGTTGVVLRRLLPEYIS
jgi:hypothetical protein